MLQFYGDNEYQHLSNLRWEKPALKWCGMNQNPGRKNSKIYFRI